MSFQDMIILQDKCEELEQKLLRAEMERGQWCSDYAASAGKLAVAVEALMLIRKECKFFQQGEEKETFASVKAQEALTKIGAL